MSAINETQHFQVELGRGCVIYRLGDRVFTSPQMLAGVTAIPLASLHRLEDKVTFECLHGECRFEGENFESRTLDCSAGPAVFPVADTNVCVFKDSGEGVDESLEYISSVSHDSQNSHSAQLDPKLRAPAVETLAKWFNALGKLQRSAVGSNQFFTEATKAIVNPGGVDSGIVLLRKEDHWTIGGSCTNRNNSLFGYRPSILDKVCQSRATVYHASDKLKFSPEGSQFVVASPLFDEKENVIGVLYGQRSPHGSNQRRGFRVLEAQFNRMVADSITAGLVRIGKERELVEKRAILNQAFSPKVARVLEKNPEILVGEKKVVSVLFADIRNYTSISDRIGCQASYQFTSDVMEILTQIVEDCYGVIIDYYGDGLAAFWNAPLDQENHADLACETALRMHESIPAIRERWQSKIDMPIQIGFGIHTGPAMVGNSGTARRLKYGPSGSTVNVASRIQNFTKEIGVPILISDETVKGIQDAYSIRRVCRTELKGIDGRNDLFQLGRVELKNEFLQTNEELQLAIDALERNDLESAEQSLNQLLNVQADDSAVIFLKSRLTEIMKRVEA